MTQDEIFAAFEGDRWFDRNHTALHQYNPDTDVPFRLIDLYHLRPKHVLEIGAANGFRVATIATRYGASGVAVEPSAAARRDGASQFPHIQFVSGEVHAVPLRESFDLIIVNFVLHWVDRVRLLQSVAEIDRLLANGGFLILGDFLPTNQTKVPYHHLTEHFVSTYKQNYAAPFLASGLYHAVGLLTGDHSAKSLRGDVEEHERVGVWLLRKSLTEYYYERTTSDMSGVRGRTA